MAHNIISRTFIIITVLFFATSIEVSAQGLEFFDDEELFNNACPSLATEDFEDTNVPDGMIGRCPNSFNSATNNACYSPGALIPGFSLSSPNPSNPAQALAVVTPPQVGTINVAAGPNILNDDAEITFTEFVNAVGMVLVSADSDTTVSIDVFGAGDVLLGSTIKSVPTVNGSFFGVTAQEQITRIEIVELDVPPGGEFIYELSFSLCRNIVRPIPTLSEWGLVAMAGVLGIVGLLAIRRRRAAA